MTPLALQTALDCLKLALQLIADIPIAVRQEQSMEFQQGVDVLRKLIGLYVPPASGASAP